MRGFEEHHTFLFGRLEECHYRLPDDGQVTRWIAQALQKK